MNVKYQIEMLIGNEWEPLWVEEGEPVTFDTFEEAFSELVNHEREIAYAIAEGDLEDYDTEHRITEFEEKTRHV